MKDNRVWGGRPKTVTCHCVLLSTGCSAWQRLYNSLVQKVADSCDCAPCQ